MFGLFKKKKNSFVSPMRGRAVSIKEVPDETFSSEMLGKGVAVIPSEGLVTSPANGKVTMVFEILHAISILADSGEEILIHIGLDTVKMKGEGFSSFVKAGDIVKVKDPFIQADLEKIKSAGVAGVIRPSKTAIQVIIGTKVQFVADEFKKLAKNK